MTNLKRSNTTIFATLPVNRAHLDYFKDDDTPDVRDSSGLTGTSNRSRSFTLWPLFSRLWQIIVLNASPQKMAAAIELTRFHWATLYARET
jgi:hypothetical protein